MDTQDAPAGGPFRTGRAHVVLFDRFEDAGADHPRVERRVEQRESQPRQDEMRHPLHEAVAEGRRTSQAAITRDREEMSLVAEEVREDEPEPNRMRGEPDQDEDRRRPVQKRARPERRQDPDRERQEQPDEGAAPDERERYGYRLADDLIHLAIAGPGLAERAVADPPQEDAVLLVDRAVDVERLADVGRVLRPPRAGDAWIAGDQKEEIEGDHRDRDEQHD